MKARTHVALSKPAARSLVWNEQMTPRPGWETAGAFILTFQNGYADATALYKEAHCRSEIAAAKKQERGERKDVSLEKSASCIVAICHLPGVPRWDLDGQSNSPKPTAEVQTRLVSGCKHG